MASVTVSQFKQLFPATATSSTLEVPIKLAIENHWDSEILQDLTTLVKMFGVSRNVHICKFEGRFL